MLIIWNAKGILKGLCTVPIIVWGSKGFYSRYASNCINLGAKYLTKCEFSHLYSGISYTYLTTLPGYLTLQGIQLLPVISLVKFVSHVGTQRIVFMLSLLSQDKYEKSEDREKMERCCRHLQIFEEGSKFILYYSRSKTSIIGLKLWSGDAFGLDF